MRGLEDITFMSVMVEEVNRAAKESPAAVGSVDVLELIIADLVE